MPKFNELLASRFADGIASLLGLSEQPGVSTVSPELMPVVVAEGDRPEHGFIFRERLCAGWGSAVADAAQYSNISLVNRIDSNVLITVERIWVNSVAGQVFYIGPILAGSFTLLSAMTAGSYSARDLRWPFLNGQAVGDVRAGSGAGGVAQLQADIELRCPAAGMEHVDTTWVIPPGTGIVVSSSAINLPVRASYQWRERALNPEERA